MKPDDINVLRTQIAPRISEGRCALLLGAGFSFVNHSVKHGKLPDGKGLVSDILVRCRQKAGKSTTLRDAYQYGRRNDPDFHNYFVERFTVNEVFDWQQKLYQYPWARIYTTNIDNVLDVAFERAQRAGRVAGEFKFFNYSDEGIVSNTIGSLPIITIHGSCLKLDEGFIFASLDYAKAASKVLDWHNDLAAWMLAGGLVVVGNQLDESDFDTYLARRNDQFNPGGSIAQNWIVMPDPDPIKAENYRAAGFYVIDATAEDFFAELYAAIPPRTIGDIVLSTIPTVKKAAASMQAMTWFRGAFSLVFDEIERAKSQKGITRHFLTGADPDWFYIVNDAHANTIRANNLLSEIQANLNKNSLGVGILHILGPSGSGKTTAIRSALSEICRIFPYVYEFDQNKSMDDRHLLSIVERFDQKSIFVFYSAADYYYAIKKITDRLKDRDLPYCLFILEDRFNDHEKNKRHLERSGVEPQKFILDSLRFEDARSIAIKMEESGLSFELFSEFEPDHRARIILDKEKGFSGDLLSALFSLTTHENFEQKIYQDYASVEGELAGQMLDVVAIISAHGHQVPVEWLSGALGEKFGDVTKILNEDLAGILIVPPGSATVKCRHRVIANYYFDKCICGNGKSGLLLSVLEYLSRQFTVAEIYLHPLAYRVYRDLVTFNFIYEKYFSQSTRNHDSEFIYHELQKHYGGDGIFWLQFGRFYRRTNELRRAIECFRIGLSLYFSYQTRHALGLALLEHFLETDCIDEVLYREGVDLLDQLRLEYSRDPYPITTLVDLLTKVTERQPDNVHAVSKRKECLNVGFKKFPGDPAFVSAAKRAISRQ